MGKCIYCHKKISLFGKDKICDDCKEKFTDLAKNLNKEMAALNDQINFNESLLYNSKIYREMIDNALKIEEIKQIIPVIKSTPFQDLINQIENNVTKWCDNYYISVSISNDKLEKALDIYNVLWNSQEYLIPYIDIEPILDYYANEINKYCCYHTEEDENGLYTMWGDKKLYYLQGKEYDFFNDSLKSLNFLFKNLPINDLKNIRFKDIIGVPTYPSRQRCFSSVDRNLRTPSGKLAKYPTRLYFVTNYNHDPNDDIFGEIYFYDDGGLGKAEIIIWKNHICYTVKIKVKEDMPFISQIFKSEKNSKELIYNN